MANNLEKSKQDAIIGALCEGASIRSTERLTGVHRDTIMRLGVRVGETCKQILDEKMRNLNCSRIEVDELWAFVGKKKARTSAADRREGMGDVWTFLSIDPVSKLMPSFRVGKRDSWNAENFMRDLAQRLANRVQISTDGLSAYADAVERAFGADVDYAQIIKEYAAPDAREARRYSPAELTAVYKTVVQGDPVPEYVCTSYIERANLTMRTHCKRLARLTLGFSKKLENFKAAVALHLAYYNFVKTHSAVRCTPAMAAGVESSHWTVADLVDAAA